MKLRENFCRGEAVLLAGRRTILWSVRAFLFHSHVVPLNPKLPRRPTVPGNYRALVNEERRTGNCEAGELGLF